MSEVVGCFFGGEGGRINDRLTFCLVSERDNTKFVVVMGAGEDRGIHRARPFCVPKIETKKADLIEKVVNHWAVEMNC